MQQQTSPKTPSVLSPDLKKLSTTYQAQKTKAPQALVKPTPGTGIDYFNKYMQIKGDKVVVDITAKEDLAAAKAELQKLGATITATTGGANLSGGGDAASARKRPYSALVTWRVASRNSSTQTRCTGFSLSCPVSQPMRNHPAGMRTSANPELL